MTSEEIRAALAPWLARGRRSAWKPVVEDGEGPSAGSKFCGVPWIGPDDPWPKCGCCDEPLTLFLQLDLDALPEELGDRFGSGLLQLFYCVRNDCQGDGGWEPFGDEVSRVRVVHPAPSAPSASSATDLPRLPAKRIVGWVHLDDLPSPEEHEEAGLNFTYDFKAGTLRLECPELDFQVEQPMSECEVEEIAVSTTGDKLAGWPAWVQGVEYPSCPRCGSRMIHLFQVDSEDHVPFMFGDAGCGHVTQCPDHKDVVAFGWACC